MKTTTPHTQGAAYRGWQKWLIVLAIGLLLPIFGFHGRTQAAASRQSDAQTLGTVIPQDDGGSDDDGDRGSDDDDDRGSDDDDDRGSDDDGDRGSDDDDDRGSDDDDDRGSDDDDDRGSDDDDDRGSDDDDDRGSDDDDRGSDDDDDRGSDDDDDRGSDDDDRSSDDSDDRGSDDNSRRGRSGSGAGETRRERDRVERTGVVNALPANGQAGLWRINGQTYIVTRYTEVSLPPGAGAIMVGQCLKLHILPGTTNVVRELDVESPEQCATTSAPTR